MTKENRELLFIDLCGRLPYGVKIKVVGYDDEFNDVEVLDCYYLHHVKNKYYRIRPYLFPMSSMTEEQKKELWEIGWSSQLCGRFDIMSYLDCLRLMEWLNKNHFDYRGLIPQGLALDATLRSSFANIKIY